MPKKRIVFLGSKSIGAFCLRYLLQSFSENELEVLAVVTKKNKQLDAHETVESLSLQNNIPVLKSVTEIPSCDMIISVQHHEILRQSDIDKAQEVAVNLHMAPLPEYRGCNQFSFAIIDGKKEFGTTLHTMTTGIDDGDIIAERRFEIDENIWVEELYDKTLAESKILFAENISAIIKGSYTVVSQASLVKKRGTSYHFRNEIEELKIIQESWTDAQKKVHVRATFKEGFEPPYALVEGNKKYYDKNSF